MLKYLLACAVLCHCGSALAADATQELTGAVKKLTDAGSYAWKSLTADSSNPGSTLIQDGKTDKSGYTLLNFNAGDNYVQFVLKDSAGVMNIGEGWKSADDLADQRRAGRVMSMMVRSFKLPTTLAGEIVSQLKDVKQDEDAYIADVSGDAANTLTNPMPGSRGGRQMSNAKATIRFWITDGSLAKYQIHTTGTMSTRNGDEIPVDRTVTIEFRDVGTTTVEVPEDAKKKLG